MQEKHPPPPHIWDKKSEQGIEDILDIDSQGPYLLFGETTFYLTSKWRGNISNFF